MQFLQDRTAAFATTVEGLGPVARCENKPCKARTREQSGASFLLCRMTISKSHFRLHTNQIYTTDMYALSKKLSLSLWVLNASQQVVRNWKLQRPVNLHFGFTLFTSCLGECRLSHVASCTAHVYSSYNIIKSQTKKTHKS